MLNRPGFNRGRHPLTAPRSKYSAQHCVLDNIKFPSRREMRRYAHLKLQEKVGGIVGLVLQPRFPIVLQRGIHLAAPLATNGQTAPAYFDGWSALQLGLVTVAEYRADFAYYDAQTGEFIVEDAKGFKTETYRLKKRLIEAQYGFVIREV
jgi:hypothetical protein